MKYFKKLICRCKSCEEMHKKMGLDLLNNKNLFKEWESRRFLMILLMMKNL